MLSIGPMAHETDFLLRGIVLARHTQFPRLRIAIRSCDRRNASVNGCVQAQRNNTGQCFSLQKFARLSTYVDIPPDSPGVCVCVCVYGALRICIVRSARETGTPKISKTLHSMARLRPRGKMPTSAKIEATNVESRPPLVLGSVHCNSPLSLFLPLIRSLLAPVSPGWLRTPRGSP